MLMRYAPFWDIMQRRECNPLPTFGDNVSVPSSFLPKKEKVPKRRSRFTIWRCVIPQKIADLIWFSSAPCFRFSWFAGGATPSGGKGRQPGHLYVHQGEEFIPLLQKVTRGQNTWKCHQWLHTGIETWGLALSWCRRKSDLYVLMWPATAVLQGKYIGLELRCVLCVRVNAIISYYIATA
jgi:hypothetical protein